MVYDSTVKTVINDKNTGWGDGGRPIFLHKRPAYFRKMVTFLFS